MYQKIIRKNLFFGARTAAFEQARYFRRHMTPAEMVLWAKLKDRKIFNVKFRRQHPAGSFVLDFFCYKFRLAIEVDGEIHDATENYEYDLNRTAELNRLGIKLLRFSNNEVFQDIDEVIIKIKENLL